MMSCILPLSRANSLIYQFFISFNTISSKRSQSAIDNQIHISPQQFTQFHIHSTVCKECKWFAGVIRYEQNVNIAIGSFLATSERTK